MNRYTIYQLSDNKYQAVGNVLAESKLFALLYYVTATVGLYQIANDFYLVDSENDNRYNAVKE